MCLPTLDVVPLLDAVVLESEVPWIAWASIFVRGFVEVGGNVIHGPRANVVKDCRADVARSR